MRLFCSMLCVLVASFLALRAQQPEQQESLFSGDIEHGFYGAYVIKGSPVRSKPQLFLGGYGGWLINHTFLVGIGGYGMATKVPAPDTVSRNLGETGMLIGYGGMVFEYTHNSNELIHFNSQLLIGGGAVVCTSVAGQLLGVDLPSTTFFTTELSAGAELNVFSFARVGVSGSYRFVSGVDIAGLSNSDISGPGVNLTFKFGML